MIKPIFFSDHEITENCGSKIHQKAIAESTVGTMNGISTKARIMRLERQLLVEQNRQVQADRELDDAGDDRVEQREEHRRLELAVADDPLVVLQADELARRADLGVGERQPDAQAERVDEEQQQERRRRQHEQQPEEVLVVPSEVIGRPFVQSPSVRAECHLALAFDGSVRTGRWAQR